MFCALNGATDKPESDKTRHTAVVTRLLPTSEAVPKIAKQRARSASRTELDATMLARLLHRAVECGGVRTNSRLRIDPRSATRRPAWRWPTRRVRVSGQRQRGPFSRQTE